MAGALESTGGGGPDPDEALEALRGSRSPEGLGPSQEAMRGALEAIVLEEMRPPYFIDRDQIEIKGDYDHVDVIQARKPALEAICRGVGRVDLFNHSMLAYAGTGWLIDRDIVVTNSHVGNIFAELDFSRRLRFKHGTHGNPMEARLDYVRQRDGGDIRRRADVLEVLYIAGPGEPDIAFLKVETLAEIEPLQLATGRVERDTPIAAVGYPAADPDRNDPVLMNDIFGGKYDVKRFSPGLVTGHESDGIVLLADYTSLGGNSGSPVIRLEDGKAIALHFAGTFKEANFSIAADIVAAARARVRTMITVPAAIGIEAAPSQPSSFAGRDGYRENFLGTGERLVPLPSLGEWSDDVAPVSDDTDGILKYRHFSVVQSKSRRLPLFTAVNIDGEQSFKLKREGDWRLDGRIDEGDQVGNELYKSNPLDRGHMVRRRDPGWGATKAEAEEGEMDTFHYTNSVPQHEDLNQIDWVGLEDYILEAAETEGFKVSVFTGPVLREEDRFLKTQPGAEDVQIPEEFWKIAVMVNSSTGTLSATGYVLSQGRMIRNLLEAEFIFGEYKTYQVQIKLIEQETGLDFGSLRDFDPLGVDTEAPFSMVARTIEGPQDLVLGRARVV